MERRYRVSFPDMALGHQSEGYQRYPRLLDIERETICILRGIQPEQAVAVALAASREVPSGSGDVHIPAVVVFSREGAIPRNVWDKLLRVMKTPDYETPSHTPELRPLIDALKGVLHSTGYADGIVGAIASGHMVRVAGGDLAAINRVYRDMARRYPQYASDWYDTLSRQFDGYLVPDSAGSSAERELVVLLERNREIAYRHDAAHNRWQEGEDLPTYICRQLQEAGEIFNIGDAEGILDPII